MEWLHQSTWKAGTRFASVVLFVFVIASCGEKDSQTPPMLGMGFDQVETLCGPGKVLGVQAQGKLVSYDHLSGVSARVGYHDNAVAKVWYDLGADSVEDKRLQYYLGLNAQGYHWTLLDATTEHTWLFAHWKRDDGATASCGGEDGPYLGIAVPGFGSKKTVAPNNPPGEQQVELRREEAEYIAKLGKPFRRATGFAKPASETLMFNHIISDSEMMIRISFWHGVAHLAIVSRRDQKDLTDTETRNILQMFSENEHWNEETPDRSEIHQEWRRGGNVMATRELFGDDNVLIIQTGEFNDARSQVPEHN